MKSIRSDFVTGIESMRGIAVIAVILYHFDTNLVPSGFLGVDLFFIISGFVITKSLYKIKAKNISEYLLYFYSARFKRIFPALIVAVFFTLILLVLTDQINTISLRTGAASLLGLSNLYLIKVQDDYFGVDQGFNVFNHTWSLGVEEQFYILLPVLLFLLKENRRALIYTSLFLLAVSFILYVSLSEHIVFQYYSPITRLWQLMMGSVAYQLYKNNNTLINPKWTILFFILVIVCFFIDRDYIAITVPTLSIVSVLLIWGVCSKEHSIISNKYLIYIGGISYSLYLYHLPIIRLLNFPGHWSIIQFALLFLLAIASVKLIEKPFRYGKLSKLTKQRILQFFSVISVISSSLIIGISYADNSYKDPFSRPGHDKLKPSRWDDIGSAKSILYSKSKKSLFFIGDSHSDSLIPMMTMLHEKDGFQVQSILTNGLFTTVLDEKSHGMLSVRGKAIVEYVMKNGKIGDVLVITNQLMQYFGKTYNQPDANIILDKKLLTKEDALSVYSSDLEFITQKLSKKGISIIIVAPFPDFPNHPIACYSPVLKTLKISTKYNNCVISRLEQDERRGNIVSVLKKISEKHSNFYIIDTINIVSKNNYISSYKDNTPLYYDDDHPNFIFNQYIYPLFINKLNSI